MKIKSIAALLSATMMMASTVVVNAANPAPTPQEHQTPVSYKYKDPSMTFDGFTVTLPASIDFTSDNKVVRPDVKVTLYADRTIPTGKGINISVKSAGGYRLQENGGIIADENHLPKYSLKATKAGDPNFGQGGNYNQVSADNNKTFINLLKSPIVQSDFTGQATENSDRDKVIACQAELTQLPTLVGVDNVTFTDILTYRVEVKATS